MRERMQIVIQIPEFITFYLLDKESFEVIVFSKHTRTVPWNEEAFYAWARAEVYIYDSYLFSCFRVCNTLKLASSSVCLRSGSVSILTFLSIENLKITLILRSVY
jgi:hypothetical protein